MSDSKRHRGDAMSRKEKEAFPMNCEDQHSLSVLRQVVVGMPSISSRA